MSKMTQGESDYTPTKQKHLTGLLGTCTWAWNPTVNGKRDWAHGEVIIIDCTAGSGRDSDGNPGSPLIVNEWAKSSYGTAFRHLCCEQQPSSFSKLWHEPMVNAEVVRGKYQEVAPQWMEGLKLTRPALGFIYCDPNGAQDLVEGIDFFTWASRHRMFKSLDFIFHWSPNAYKRNAGRGYAWAQRPLQEVVQHLARIKQHAYMRAPMDKWQWVFMHCINTEKVKPVWKSEQIVPYAEWRDTYAEKVLA